MTEESARAAYMLANYYYNISLPVTTGIFHVLQR